MSDSLPPSSPSPVPPSEPNQPLEYESPVIDPNRPAGGVPYVLQVVIGAFSFYAAMGVAFGLGILTSYESPVPFFVFLIVMLAAVITLAIVARIRWRWRGALLGVLIALGLSVLACGMCFAIFSRGF